MNIRRILLSLLVFCSVSAFALTDKQVIDYIKQQTAAGKSEQQIGKELLAKGVTPEQAKRIKAMYDSQQSSDNAGAAASTDNRVVKRGTQSIRVGTDQLKGVDNVSESVDVLNVIPAPDDFDPNAAPQQQIQNKRTVFGQDVFRSNSLTFEPNENLATPQNYRLGPNDEIVIDIWGASEDHLRQVISPEGSIMISQLGPIYLNGLTVSEASKRIKNAFSKKYSGMEDSETDIQVALGQVRTIQVDVMGEVITPGTFRISPFATVFNALYNAGGINDIGSLRNIQVLRNGKKIAGVDVYEYLLNGKSSGNIRLQEGDVIIVPPYDQLVNVSGNVKRPMYYEVKPNETVKDVLDFAGGFTGDAYSGMVRLSRRSGTENELFNVEKGEFTSYKLRDGDELTVGTILDRYANRVELKGAVYRPGLYALNSDLSTVGELVRKADGLTDNAYTDRVLLYREGPDLQLQIYSFNIADILSGKVPDMQLKRNDILEIMTVQEIFERGDLTIRGEVALPGTYPYADFTTLEDLILQAGGLLEGASTARVDIARRIIDPTSTEQSQSLSQVFSVSIENGLAVGDKAKSFYLKPYDVVTVRRSPGYEAQEFVRVDGNVLFTGEYALQKRNERLSDVVRRAGGVLDGAYVKGARLTRMLSEDEYAARQEAMRLAMSNSSGNIGDSIALSKITVADHYGVGIDLQKALENPGSHYDIVLKPGDQLYVPEEQSTVKITGDVMFPNVVAYEPGKKMKYYIDQAGGYGQTAKKGKAFIVYCNGTVAKMKGSTPIEPGSQIIVPSKPANSGTDWTKILTFATSFSSVAAMAATITNLFK